MRILCKNFKKEQFLFRKGYILFLSTKITICPRYVRHVSLSQDVCLRLMAKYLHIPNLKLKMI